MAHIPTTPVATPDLAQGMIVSNYGMRLLIDGPAKIWEANNGHGLTTVYAWPGKIINLAEITDRFILAHHDAGYWSIQGNDLARWYVETPTAAAE